MAKLQFILSVLLMLPASAFGETASLVVIEKGKRLLTLFSDQKIIGKYSVALGKAPVGPKQCQGDGKTPEGDYMITGRNRDSAFHRSLRVSYPNEKDIQNANKLDCSPGGEIMIHGLPNGIGWIGAIHRLRDWTLGCIAVNNKEIEEIWQKVPDGTKVKIVP